MGSQAAGGEILAMPLAPFLARLLVLRLLVVRQPVILLLSVVRPLPVPHPDRTYESEQV